MNDNEPPPFLKVAKRYEEAINKTIDDIFAPIFARAATLIPPPAPKPPRRNPKEGDAPQTAAGDRKAKGIEKLFDDPFAHLMARKATPTPPESQTAAKDDKPPPAATLWTRVKAYGVRITPYLLRGLKYGVFLLFWLFLCVIGDAFLSLLLWQDVTPNTLKIFDYGLYALLFILWMGPITLKDCAPETPLTKSTSAFWGGVFEWFEESPKIRGVILFGFFIGLNIIAMWHAEFGVEMGGEIFPRACCGLGASCELASLLARVSRASSHNPL